MDTQPKFLSTIRMVRRGSRVIVDRSFLEDSYKLKSYKKINAVYDMLFKDVYIFIDGFKIKDYDIDEDDNEDYTDYVLRRNIKDIIYICEKYDELDVDLLAFLSYNIRLKNVNGSHIRPIYTLVFIKNNKEYSATDVVSKYCNNKIKQIGF